MIINACNAGSLTGPISALAFTRKWKIYHPKYTYDYDPATSQNKTKNPSPNPNRDQQPPQALP